MAWPWTTSDARRMWTVMGVLLLAVLAPTVCVLWFMNEAVTNERLAVRQRLQEVYERELTLRQKRLDEAWEKVLAALQASQEKAAPVAFAELVKDAGLSGVLVYRDGQLAYPQPIRPATGPLEGQAPQAQSLLAEARQLLETGQASQAAAILGETLQQPTFSSVADAEGRLIAPSGALLAVESLLAEMPERVAIARRLAERLRQYDGPPMGAAQRLFLMQRLHALAGGDFPTMAGENLALQLAQLDPGWDPEAIGKLWPIPGMAGVWVYQDASSRAIFTRDDLEKRFGAVVQGDAPAETAITFFAPGARAPGEFFVAVPAGRVMHDWTMGLSLLGPDPFGTAARRHAAAYLWTAALAIGTIVLLASGLGVYLSRQMRLTRLKNDLIATVSHELKTPLSSMRVLVDTLIDERVPGAREQREYLGLIAKENMRLSRLIDNFLTFSRMERHKAVFDFRRVSVEEITRAALDAMGDRAAAVQVAVPANLAVWGDADALTTLLVNLLDNAWKYSGKARRTEVTATAAAGMVEIAVCDWGIGMGRRHHRRIFQRFYQIDRELSRRTGGCGLGLAIVDYIARAHHGTVTVESVVGQGSTFRVRLPVCAAVGAGAREPGAVGAT